MLPIGILLLASANEKVFSLAELLVAGLVTRNGVGNLFAVNAGVSALLLRANVPDPLCGSFPQCATALNRTPSELLVLSS